MERHFSSMDFFNIFGDNATEDLDPTRTHFYEDLDFDMKNENKFPLDMDIVKADDDRKKSSANSQDPAEQDAESAIQSDSTSSVVTAIMSEEVYDPMLDEALENPNAIQKVWDQELYKMKPVEREAAYNELHGVEFDNISQNADADRPKQFKGVKNESPFLIASSLREMQDALDEIVPLSSLSPTSDGDGARPKHYAYQRGLEINSAYICSPEYRLKFLRADQFDAKRAAARYCECLDLMYDCFGEKIFYRQLYLSDLDCISHKLLRDGNIQILPSRDRIGRRVFVMIGRPAAETAEEVEAAFRSMLYLFWAVICEDVTTQVKGVVVLVFPLFDQPNVHKGDAKLMMKNIATMPVRYTAIHFCIPDDPIFRAVRSMCLALIGRERRRICRVHAGSAVEVDYALSSYGIIVKDIPRTYSFMIKTKNWFRFLKVRSAIDDYRKRAEVANAAGLMMAGVELEGPCGVECPEVNCILFGNKAMAWDHPGNIEFRDLIEEKELERDMQCRSKSTSRYKGDKYNDYIIEEGRSRKFVFMDYDKENSWYTEITDHSVLRHKITQLLTGIRKRRKAARIAFKTKMDLRADTPPPAVGLDGTASEANRCGFLCNFEKKNNTET